MKEERYEEAINLYTKAIGLDGRNAVYYCNRLNILLVFSSDEGQSSYQFCDNV